MAVDIGDGAGNPQGPVQCPPGQCHPQRGGFQVFLFLPAELADSREAVRGNLAIGAALAQFLCRPAGADAGAHGQGRLVVATGFYQLRRRQSPHRHVQVDAIQQGPGNPGPVALDLFGGAAAGALGVPQVAAGAGVHRRHQLEAGGVAGSVKGPRQGDLAGLHGLSQHLQAVAVEFRQLVQEQDAAVGEGYLPWARSAAAASQGRGGGRVVRRAKRAAKIRRRIRRVEEMAQRQQGERLLRAGWGQDTGQAAGQQGLARAGRAKKQQVVIAAGSDFQCPPGPGLACDITQVRIAALAGDRFRRAVVYPPAAIEVGAQAEQITGRDDPAVGGEGCQRRAGGRHYQLAPAPTGRAGRGNRPGHRPQTAVEGEFAQEFMLVEQVLRQLAGRGENAKGDGQVEAPALLGQVRGGEVDGNAPIGEGEV